MELFFRLRSRRVKVKLRSGRVELKFRSVSRRFEGLMFFFLI